MLKKKTLLIFILLCGLSSCELLFSDEKKAQREAEDMTEYSYFISKIGLAKVRLMDGSMYKEGSASSFEDDFLNLKPIEVGHESSPNRRIIADKMLFYVPATACCMEFNAKFDRFSISYSGHGLDYVYYSERFYEADAAKVENIYKKAQELLKGQ